MLTKPKFQILASLIAFICIVTVTLAIDKADFSVYPALPEDYDFNNGEAKIQSFTEREPTKDEIAITKKYYEIAEKWVGAFPLKLIDAREAQPMLVLRTQTDGKVDTLTLEDITAPSVPRIRARDSLDQLAALKRGVTQSDKPSAIFRDMVNLGTMPGSRIMRVSTDSVDWVYIFRKTSKFFNDPNLFEENGLIAYNRNSGKTVFFAGAESWQFTIKGPWKSYGAEGDTTTTVSILAGKEIPPPSSKNLISVKNWRIPIGNGCTSCHSAGPFVSFPFTDYAGYEKNGSPRYYKQPKGQKSAKNLGGDFGDNVVPMRTPGMLYEPLVYQLNDEFREFIKNYKPQNHNDSLYKTIKKSVETPKSKLTNFKVKRLINPELQACRSCHQIGNLNYLNRFPFEAFWFPGLPESQSLHIRARLYRKNISAALLNKPNLYGFDNGDTSVYNMAGFHNRRLELGELYSFQPEDSTVYSHALIAIDSINRFNKKPQLDDHWTLDRVRKKPWLYFKEVCSGCHNGTGSEGKSQIDFSTEKILRDYLKQEGKPTEFRKRLTEYGTGQMPPGGLLQETVRNELVQYLESLNN